MWLCAMRRNNLTSSGLISFTASEMLFWNAWAKYVCIIVLHDCVPKQQPPPPKAMAALIVFRLLALRSDLLYMKVIIFSSLILVFYWLFSASLPGRDGFVLFDSLDGNGACSQMFLWYFAHELNSQLWMETRLVSECSYPYDGSKGKVCHFLSHHPL